MRPAADTTDFKRDLVGLLPRLRRFALTLTGNPADADDLVHAVCERAISRNQHWDGEGRLESWIYGMARNLWAEGLRRRKAAAGGDIGDKSALLREATGDKAFQGNPSQEMLLSMPEGLASAFVLVTLEGYSYREAAEILKIPIGTVMSRLSSARIRLSAMTAHMSERRA